MGGSYRKCLQSIRRLVDHKINLRLKTILMTLNRHEFDDMEQMAKEYGVEFRFDAAIFPRFDGDKTPLNLRVSPKEAVKKEFSDDGRLRQWKDYFDTMQAVPLQSRLYACGAGVISFHINPYGSLQPCLMVNSLQYDLKHGRFLSGWRDVIAQIMNKKAGVMFPCNSCEKRTLCGFCPAFFQLENGVEDVCSTYLCTMGQYRFQAIQDSVLAGVPNDIETR
jgi:radical SAM protein with 4Fe4S-binding SPASM domain